MAFVLTRVCAKPLGNGKTFLNQADAMIAPWLGNFAEFVGRFFKKHPQADLNGILQVIAKRINSDSPGGEHRDPGAPPAEYKGESLIRVVLEALIEHMGGQQSVADLTSE